jgi:hypothetical protein
MNQLRNWIDTIAQGNSREATSARLAAEVKRFIRDVAQDDEAGSYLITEARRLLAIIEASEPERAGRSEIVHS